MNPNSLEAIYVSSSYLRWKRILDCVVAVVMLVPGAPAILFLVILVRLTSKGPGVLRQRRVGMRGKVFVMFKIRTMIDGAEATTGPTWAGTRDPRCIPFGQIMRDFRLDELPQLFNVLRGDMSIVGPRPERPELAEPIAQEVPRYFSRLTVPQGVTGLAQLNLPPDIGLDGVQRKLQLDLEYANTCSIWLDFRIMLYPILRLILVSNGKTLRVLGLARKSPAA